MSKVIKEYRFNSIFVNSISFEFVINEMISVVSWMITTGLTFVAILSCSSKLIRILGFKTATKFLYEWYLDLLLIVIEIKRFFSHCSEWRCTISLFFSFILSYCIERISCFWLGMRSLAYRLLHTQSWGHCWNFIRNNFFSWNISRLNMFL